MKTIIKDPYYKNLLEQIGFNKSVYKKSDVGLLLFLMDNDIKIKVWMNSNGKFQYACAQDKNMFTQDLNEYKTAKEASKIAVMESICYLSLNK